MKKAILLSILAAGCIAKTYAQEEAQQVPKVKKYDHYVGVQLNNLIHQVVDFNNNTSTAPVNPYLLTYSMNSVKSGWGFRAGAGYNYASTYNNDGVTETSTKINDLHVRAGVEKRFNLGRKWIAGAGIDGLYNLNNDNTTSTVHSFDTVITTTKSKAPSYGGGAMGWLRYSISEKVLIGTEASLYYVTGKANNTVEVTHKRPSSVPPFESIVTMTTTESKPTISNGTFSSPIVFFIMVKF